METFETPQPIPEPKNTNWPRIILAAVLGLGLLAGAAYAGYWYGTQEISNLKNQISKLQLKTQVQVTSTPTPAPLLETTPTPTSSIEDETKSWKVYRSTRFSYEIKYPLEMTLEGRPTGAPDYYDDVSFSIIGETQPEGAHFSDGLSVSVRREDNPKELSLSDWVEEKFAGGYPTVTKIEDVSMRGLVAVRAVGYGVSPFDEVFLLQNKHVLIVGASYVGPNGDRYEEIFNLVLSTFKFLN